jgi:hypothetical protein
MKQSLLILGLLLFFGIPIQAQSLIEKPGLDLVSIEFGALIADNDRLGFHTGLHFRANKHLFQFQYSQERQFDFELEWMADGSPKKAAVMGTDYFGLLYGYSFLHEPNFQLTSSLGFVVGQELYRNGQYDEVEGFLWNTYSYYYQLNNYFGASCAFRVQFQYRFLNIPWNSFVQMQMNYYGRGAISMRTGLAVNLYKRKSKSQL